MENEQKKKTSLWQGVSAIEIEAVNPNKEECERLGLPVMETYVHPERTLIRFALKLLDVERKPVTYADFILHDKPVLTKNTMKCKIIDDSCNVAWGTMEEVKQHKIPTYKGYNGQPVSAGISSDYRICHWGEEELLMFLIRYFGLHFGKSIPLPKIVRSTAKDISDGAKRHCLYDWDKLVNGDVSDIYALLEEKEPAGIRAVFGVQSREGKRYQAMMKSNYLSKGVRLGTDGSYGIVRFFIDDAAKKGDRTLYSSFLAFEYKSMWDDIDDDEVEIK